jgi:hypothetical protein
MPNPLLSRYSQGENRVTSSILAVFERISFALVERILQILCEEPNLPLLQIRNQIKTGKTGRVPDGALQASFAYWIETKTERNAVNSPQIQGHLDALSKTPDFAKKKLLVLTPDYEEPQVIKDLKSDLIVWANFNNLYAAIAEITASSENSETGESWLASDFSPPSEQERFLLRELVQMLLAEGLLNNGNSDDVLIVPARAAIHDYNNFSVYLCQPNRSFQGIEYIGFYHDGVIDSNIAKILYKPIEEVELSEEGIENLADSISPEVKSKLSELVHKLEIAGSVGYRLGGTFKVFFLSSPDSPDTVKLKNNIKNDQKSYSGKPTAYVQKQKYRPLSVLQKNPATTIELDSFWKQGA